MRKQCFFHLEDALVFQDLQGDHVLRQGEWTYDVTVIPEGAKPERFWKRLLLSTWIDADGGTLTVLYRTARLEKGLSLRRYRQGNWVEMPLPRVWTVKG